MYLESHIAFELGNSGSHSQCVLDRTILLRTRGRQGQRECRAVSSFLFLSFSEVIIERLGKLFFLYFTLNFPLFFRKRLNAKERTIMSKSRVDHATMTTMTQQALYPTCQHGEDCKCVATLSCDDCARPICLLHVSTRSSVKLCQGCFVTQTKSDTKFRNFILVFCAL